MVNQESYDALRHSKLASELSDDQCRMLAEQVTLRDLPHGQVLVKEGESDNHLYTIVRGAISVVRNALPLNSYLAIAQAAITPKIRFAGTAIKATVSVSRMAASAS